LLPAAETQPVGNADTAKAAIPLDSKNSRRLMEESPLRKLDPERHGLE
jgi:hypothetical protein